MASVRCPMCSKLNEEDVEVCAYCGARLKPLRPSSAPLSGEGLAGGAEDEEPAWLRDLRLDDQQGSTPRDSEESAEKPEVPDWLSRIREKAREETVSSPGLPGAEEETQPDWMKDLQSEAGAPGDIEPEGDDWLGRIRPDQETPGEASVDFDLLSSAVSAPEEPEPAPGSRESSGFGLTGFLASLEKEEADQPASQPEAPPVWGQPEAELPELELPEWGQAEQGTDAGLPGWLSGSEFAGAAPAEDITPAGPENLPDWLSSITSSETGQVEPESGLTSSEKDENESAGLPGWLSDETAKGAPLPPVEDWEPEGRLPGTEDEFPDWLAGIGGADREGQARQPAGVSDERTPADLPDWLKAEEEPESVPGVAGPEITLPGELYTEAPAQGEPAAELPLMDEITPDWLREMAAQPDEAIFPLSEEGEPSGIEADQAFPSAELPGWLDEAAGETMPEAAEQSIEEPAGEELAAAELPDWVREMRPIESVDLGEPVLPEADQRVEKAGPLAGLRGILPAEDIATRYRKPPVYSARLRVSEKQRSQASLLESILEQEAQPILIPPVRSRAPHLIGQILIALLWLTIIAAPFVLQVSLEPALMRTPPELERMFNLIDQPAQADRPVLLAVDYEPALAGEMTLAAQPVVEHLMSRNTRIVVVSTVPAGPILSQSLLEKAAESLAGQTPPQQYDLLANSVNLGYLPGGTISLLEFAQFPRQAAPASMTGDYEVWNGPILAPLNSLKDFAQVIVITDSAETGRAWVEQVQPLMGGVPLLMVVSAQAQPQLMPYVDSGQIDGLAGGVLGGVLYNQWRQAAPVGGVYWSAYQFGIGLAFLLVLAGGLVSGGAAFLKRSSKDEA